MSHTKIHTKALPYQIGDRVTTMKYQMPIGTIMGYIYWPTDWCATTDEPLNTAYLIVDDNGYEKEVFEGSITGVVLS